MARTSQHRPHTSDCTFCPTHIFPSIESNPFITDQTMDGTSVVSIITTTAASRTPLSEPILTRLDIFDFDNTLFKSPVPNPQLWDSHFLGLLMGYGRVGKGWYHDLRTLELGEQVESSGWAGWWNEEVVSTIFELIYILGNVSKVYHAAAHWD